MSSEAGAPWRHQQQQQAGGAPPPPPPPPPPGQPASVRLKTEIPAMRAEPPACVQNAMMTKDKKPFTYTPGGLDLSQIRSPRMARRLTRNANSEGVESVPTGVNLTPTSVAEPQVVPQPQAVPQPPPPPPPQFQVPPTPPVPPLELSPPITQAQRPHVVIPAAALGRGAQVGTLYVPPLESPVTLNKAPTPWLTRPPQQPEPQPTWVTARDPQQYRPVQPQTPSPQTPSPQTPSSPTPYKPPQQQAPTTRIVPVHIQMTPQQSLPQQTPPLQTPPPTVAPQVVGPTAGRPMGHPMGPPMGHPLGYPIGHPAGHPLGHPGGHPVVHPGGYGPVTRIIPIQLESDSGDGMSPSAMFPPVQSPAFRVLQKMTSRPGDDPAEQMRRMQLSDEDRVLMNRLRAQVDEENFLHNETDPRYRGAAIPSRAFRILQSMTEPDGAGGASVQQQQARQPQSMQNARQQQAQVPASEQRPAEEPRKYTGGAIPSRSFQMLQAMVSPDNCGPGQSDL